MILQAPTYQHPRTIFVWVPLGAFHYARPTGQRPVELTKGKWNDIVRKKQNFQPDRSVPFTFRPKFRLLLSEVGLETRIFENGTASFGRTGLSGQRGPPLEVDHFFRKISTWTEAFRLCFDRNFRKFWHNGKHPLFLVSWGGRCHLLDDWLRGLKKKKRRRSYQIIAKLETLNL